MNSQHLLIAERRAKEGCAPAYEAVVGGMFGAARDFPGFQAATVTPPASPGGKYRVVMRFDSEEHLHHWKNSGTRMEWQRRIDSVAEGEPEFLTLTGMEAWFTGPVIAGGKPPERWKMAVLTWLGLIPTVSFVLGLLGPVWQGQPPFHGFSWMTIVLTAANTLVITLFMTWLVMPNLTKLFRGFLAGRT